MLLLLMVFLFFYYCKRNSSFFSKNIKYIFVRELICVLLNFKFLFFTYQMWVCVFMWRFFFENSSSPSSTSTSTSLFISVSIIVFSSHFCCCCCCRNFSLSLAIIITWNNQHACIFSTLTFINCLVVSQIVINNTQLNKKRKVYRQSQIFFSSLSLKIKSYSAVKIIKEFERANITKQQNIHFLSDFSFLKRKKNCCRAKEFYRLIWFRNILKEKYLDTKIFFLYFFNYRITNWLVVYFFL